MRTAAKPPHPVVWAILYLPYGALSGFVTVALTYLATEHGLSITQGALLGGAHLLTQWLKCLWAPVVDITLTPKRWYVLALALSALGIVAMSAIPMAPATLPLLLGVIAAASVVSSIAGMSVAAMASAVTPRWEIGRVSGWLQTGHLGGVGVGGGLGLLLMKHFLKRQAPWMAGASMALVLGACGLGLIPLAGLADTKACRGSAGKLAAVRGVARDLGDMLRQRPGILAAVISFLPLATGAAQGVLTQAEVAARWGAGAAHVEAIQGVSAGIVMTFGCFGGGWVCRHVKPTTANAGVGLAHALIACGMALAPATIAMYVLWNLVYAFAVGLAYATFTAVTLEAMIPGSAATKYTALVSLSNFPLWWLGLLLARIADAHGVKAMLYTEAALGFAGVAVFAAATQLIKTPAPAPTPEVAAEMPGG
jgi:hypothetical protein